MFQHLIILESEDYVKAQLTCTLKLMRWEWFGHVEGLILWLPILSNELVNYPFSSNSCKTMENLEKIFGFEIFTIHTTPLLNYCVYVVDLHITIKELPLFHYLFLVNEVLAHILLSSKMDIFSLFLLASFMYLIPEGECYPPDCTWLVRSSEPAKFEHPNALFWSILETGYL